MEDAGILSNALKVDKSTVDSSTDLGDIDLHV